MDTDLAATGQGIETVQVVDQLGFAVEDALTLGAPLVDVVDLAAFEGAESGRKLGSAFVGHLLISVFSAGKFSHILNLFFAHEHMQETSHGVKRLITIRLARSRTKF